ncbi:uncharacterized protein LOC143037839 [Oratosquilla oratoria]|uniref:uncharacterized protein LOC143037839 n=1 Tax=Oratosquilla oratoria TaxID=337810 RepID=UPI003F76B489
MDVFKVESVGPLGSGGVGEVKVTTPEVTFDTSTDFNLAFFDSATPPPPPPGAIKKEDFDDGVFDRVAPDSLFSPTPLTPDTLKGEFSPFTTEESKYTSFSDSAAPYSHESVSALSPASTPTPTPVPSAVASPSPSPSSVHTPLTLNHHSKTPIVIKSEHPQFGFQSSNRNARSIFLVYSPSLQGLE